MTSEAFLGYVVLGFNPFLVQLEINGDLTDEQYQSFFGLIPTHQDGFKEFRQKITQNGTAKIEEHKEGLKFESFWDRYAYKAGNKKRAEQLWNGLSKANKNKAIFYLGIYDRELRAKPYQQKLYADSYLKQQRWNNS
jgi:hypothetical protein